MLKKRNYNESATVQEEFAEKNKWDNRRDMLMKLAPVNVLIVLVIVFVSVCGLRFISGTNLLNLLNQTALPLVIALGLTFVILIGSIDLSIDGSVGMAGSIFACLVLNTLYPNNDFGFMGAIIAIAISGICGLLLGLTHVYLRIPSFIASFAFMYICKGIGMLSYSGHLPTITDPVVIQLAKVNILGIPFITWVAVLMFIICWYVQEYTAFGRYIYAIGTNENVPRAVGINVEKTKIMVFTFAGMLYGVAGVLGAIRLGQGQVAIGTDKMFPAQAAVVVGGTSLSGGKGGVTNTVVGVLIMSVLDNGLIMLGVDPVIRTGMQGLIILLSVIITATRGNKTICK